MTAYRAIYQTTITFPMVATNGPDLTIAMAPTTLNVLSPGNRRDRRAALAKKRRRTLKREIRRRERFARNRDLNASTRRRYANYSS